MADYIQGPDLAALYTEQAALVQKSQAKQAAARQFLAGEFRAPLDESLLKGNPDRESLRASNSEKYIKPKNIGAKLMKTHGKVTREAVGTSRRAGLEANESQGKINAALDQTFPDDVVIDNLLQEGQCVVITQFNTTNWDRNPHNSLFTDPEARDVVKPRYASDSQGRGASDPYFRESSRRQFKLDMGKSTARMSELARGYDAKNLPITQQAYSGQVAIVINPRRDGKFMRVDGVIIKEIFSVSSLLSRGYYWDPDSKLMQDPQASGSGASSSGGNQQATMHTLIEMGPNGPYISRSINGMKTTKNGEDAIEDLGKLFGIEQLPVAFDYGQHWPGALPDQRPIPFVDPYARSWMNQDSLTSSVLTRAFKEANFYKGIKLDMTMERFLEGNSMPPPLEYEAGTMPYIMGDMQELLPANTLRDLSVIMTLLKADLGESLPSADAFGGGQNVAGFAQNVASDAVLDTVNQVPRGYLNIKAQSAGHMAEQCVAIAKKKSRPVCLYVNQDVPMEQTGQQSSARAIVEISEDEFADVYDFGCEIPKEHFGDPIKANQVSGFHDKGQVTTRQLLEVGFNDPTPDITEAALMAEKAENTPLGQATYMAEAMKIVGDQRTQKLMEGLAAQELMKLDPNGPPTQNNVRPVGIMAGVPPPPGPQGGAPGQNMVGQQVGGVVSGGSQASAMARNGTAGQGQQGMTNGQ